MNFLEKTAITLFLLACTLWSVAQPSNHDDRHEKIKVQKVAFITTQLELSVEEAQMFWPVYNEYNDKLHKLKKEQHQLLHRFHQDSDKLTDKDLEELSDKFIALQVEEANTRDAYHQKLKTILPIRKVVSYYQAEAQFKRLLMKRLKEGPANQPRVRDRR